MIMVAPELQQNAVFVRIGIEWSIVTNPFLLQPPTMIIQHAQPHTHIHTLVEWDNSLLCQAENIHDFI